MMRTHRRSGGIVLVVALSLLVILGFAALVLDVGYARLVHTQLQAAADSASLSASTKLDGTPEGLIQARNTAVEIAAQNQAHGVPVALDPNPANAPGGDVVLGTWSGGLFTPSDDPQEINAVQVLARSDTLTPLLSGVSAGSTGLDTAAVAVAARGTELGAGEVPYYLPFGIAQCVVDGYSTDDLQEMTFVLGPAGVDNTGWAMIGSSPSTSALEDHLINSTACMQQWYSTGELDDSCAGGWIEDDLGLSNGEMTSALKAIADLIETDGLPWMPDIWGPLPEQDPYSDVAEDAFGQLIAGPFPVFDGGDEYCEEGGGNWVGTVPLTGFVWGAIYDVRWKGAAATKNVWVRIDPSSTYPIGDWWGGGSHGITVTGPPVLVQ